MLLRVLMVLSLPVLLLLLWLISSRKPSSLELAVAHWCGVHLADLVPWHKSLKWPIRALWPYSASVLSLGLVLNLLNKRRQATWLFAIQGVAFLSYQIAFGCVSQTRRLDLSLVLYSAVVWSLILIWRQSFKRTWHRVVSIPLLLALLAYSAVMLSMGMWPLTVMMSVLLGFASVLALMSLDESVHHV